MRYEHLFSNDEVPLFDIRKFEYVCNGSISPHKPKGGFWASPVRSDDGTEWRDVCSWEYPWSYNRGFRFSVVENAKILTVSREVDIQLLPKRDPDTTISGLITIDWSTIASTYDAFLVEDEARQTDQFWGWDADSLVVMNPSIMTDFEDVEVEHEDMLRINYPEVYEFE